MAGCCAIRASVLVFVVGRAGQGPERIQFFFARRYPKSPARFIFFPAIFGASGLIPPATLNALLCWLIIGIVFNVIIKSKYAGWWARYNYVLSAALDIGTALCLVVFALGIGLSESSFPAWWGSVDYANTLDQEGLSITRVLADGESFGPSSWE